MKAQTVTNSQARWAAKPGLRYVWRARCRGNGTASASLLGYAGTETFPLSSTTTTATCVERLLSKILAEQSHGDIF